MEKAIFLETERLIIKQTTLEDLDNLCVLQSDNEVMKYVGKGVRTPAEVKHWLEQAFLHHQRHGFSFGSLFEKESGNFIGQGGMMYFDYDDTQPDIEVGYRLSKNYWNKGYATELSKASIAWGFKNLNVNKLTAFINPENEKSRRVLDKVGMNYIGKIKCFNTEVERYEIDRNNI